VTVALLLFRLRVPPLMVMLLLAVPVALALARINRPSLRMVPLRLLLPESWRVPEPDLTSEIAPPALFPITDWMSRVPLPNSADDQFRTRG